MAKGAIVFTWGPSVRGRERQSLEVFGESLAYWDDLVKNHRVDAHHAFVSDQRNGGTWIVRGDLEELMRIQQEDGYVRLRAAAQMTTEDVVVETYRGGSSDDLQDVIGVFDETIRRFD